MLDGKYINNKIQGYCDQLPVVAPLVHIGLGVARPFDEPYSVFGVNYPLDGTGADPGYGQGAAQDGRTLTVLISLLFYGGKWQDSFWVLHHHCVDLFIRDTP